jgi:predicted molibdopterin-dependent oxidoreductase YjgC
VRRGERLEPASWDEALEQAVSGLRKVMNAGGEVGVLGSARVTNEESYLVARLARGGLQTPHVDSVLRFTYQPLLDGIVDVGGPAAVRGALEELERCDAILLVEGDLARSHPRLAFSVMKAVKNGARLVTLGWVRTPLARLSALHLPMVPCREAAAALGLAAAARKSAALEGLDAGNAWRERLAAGSPSEADGRVAEWFCRARRAGVLIAPLGAPAADARELAQALAVFVWCTGHLRRSGSVLLPLPVLSNLRGACEMGVLPDRLPGGWPLDGAEARARLRSLWGREACAAAGVDAIAMPERLSGLIAVADETAAAAPFGRAALGALARLPFLVVVDAFMTPTVRLAHVALPMAATVEAEGRVTNLEGRVQELRPATPPPGLARAGWRVLSDLGSRFGLPARYRSLVDVRQELAAAVPIRGDRAGAPGRLEPLPSGSPVEGTNALVRDGVYDWGSDPLVSGSPTLRRDSAARARRFPQGCVELSVEDAGRLGLRVGSRLRLRSGTEEAVAPIVPRPELQPGIVLVPYPFREHLARLLGERGRTEVTLSRA